MPRHTQDTNSKDDDTRGDSVESIWTQGHVYHQVKVLVTHL